MDSYATIVQIISTIITEVNGMKIAKGQNYWRTT